MVGDGLMKESARVSRSLGRAAEADVMLFAARETVTADVASVLDERLRACRDVGYFLRLCKAGKVYPLVLRSLESFARGGAGAVAGLDSRFRNDTRGTAVAGQEATEGVVQNDTGGVRQKGSCP